jgi:hypothetical protein
VFSADIRRFHPDCTDSTSKPARRWLAERSHETYANQSVIAYSHDQPLGGARHQHLKFAGLTQNLGQL